MVVQVENSPKRSSGQISFCSVPQFAVNCSSLWHMHDQDSSEMIAENLSSTGGSPLCDCLEAKPLGPQLLEHESSSIQSTSQSEQEATFIENPNPQEQRISSETVHDENYEKNVQVQPRPAFMVYNPSFCANPLQLEMGQPTIHVPYNYADPYFCGLFPTYGPHASVQPHMVGTAAPGRVPLPFDPFEDRPIYVNAKQFHGILRRRQTRAKLEAQNKLVKARKPYLHESRHLHALNRVRGSGGRFVGKKKTRQSEATSSTSSSDSILFNQKGKTLGVDEHQFEASERTPLSMCYDMTQNTNVAFNLEDTDHRFSSISPHMAISYPGRAGHSFMCNGEQHGAHVVQ